jgi:uncharacterized protein (TIGR03067 family)
MKALLVFDLLFLLACLSFASFPAQAAASSGTDARNILGVWKGGMPGEPPGSIELTITPERITGRNPRTGESLGEGTYQLDPTQKTIDVVRLEKFGRGRSYVGLYSLEGDTLKWVSNSRGKQRPKDLRHRPERDQFLMVLERQR